MTLKLGSPNLSVLLVLSVALLAAAYGCSGDARGLLFTDHDGDKTLTLYGTVDVREVALAFRLPGRLVGLAVEEGDEVAAGDVIADLEKETFTEDLAVAEARVEVARAHLSRIEIGSRPQEIQQARAAVDEAEARATAARQELDRKIGLLAPGAASEREVEAARERHDAAAARLNATREALDLAREGARAEDVTAVRAELRLAEAELERAQTALDDTRLLAPSSGTVTTRVREPGSMVPAGAPVAVLTLHHPLVVRAYVPEPQLGRVAPGTRVQVVGDSSSEIFNGTIGFVSPRAEFTPKTVETPDLRTDLVYRLRIVIDDPEGELHLKLRQGMPVTVNLAETAETSETSETSETRPESDSQRNG